MYPSGCAEVYMCFLRRGVVYRNPYHRGVAGKHWWPLIYLEVFWGLAYHSWGLRDNSYGSRNKDADINQVGWCLLVEVLCEWLLLIVGGGACSRVTYSPISASLSLSYSIFA